MSNVTLGGQRLRYVYVGPDRVWPPTTPFNKSYGTGPYNTSTPKVISGVDIGIPAPNRQVFVLIGEDSSSASGAVTSVTIGGVGATLVTSAGSDVRRCYIYTATVPTGLTANISIATNGQNIGVWVGICVMYGVTILDTTSAAALSTGANLSWNQQAVVLAVATGGGITSGVGAISSNPAAVSREAAMSSPSGSIQVVCGIGQPASSGTNMSLSYSFTMTGTTYCIAGVSLVPT